MGRAGKGAVGVKIVAMEVRGSVRVRVLRNVSGKDVKVSSVCGIWSLMDERHFGFNLARPEIRRRRSPVPKRNDEIDGAPLNRTMRAPRAQPKSFFVRSCAQFAFTLLLASAGAVRLMPTPIVAPTGVFILRGGKVAEPPKAFPKAVDDWTGDTKDMGIGAALGFGAGVIVGTAVKAMGNLAQFLRAQLAVTVLLQKLGIVEVHPMRVLRLVPSPVIKFLDANGDGKLTVHDALAWGQRGAKEAKKMDKNKDGKVDENDLQMLFTCNQHGAAGTALGFTLGLVKGVGLA